MENKSSSGMTLLENTLALALMVLLSSALMTVYWASSKAFSQVGNISEIQYNVREASQLIRRDLYSSESAEVLDAYGRPVAFGVSGIGLRLVVPVASEAGVLYHSVSYYCQNHTLYRERRRLDARRSSSDGQLLDKIPCADRISLLSFSTTTFGAVEYEVTGGEDGFNFCLNGRGSSRAHGIIE
jgi:hypothetical protein